MTDPINIERPRVSRVEVTVKPPDANVLERRTEIRITAESVINEENFDYFPRIEFPVGDVYQIRGERIFGKKSRTVIYTENGMAFERPESPLVTICFVRDDSREIVTLTYTNELFV